MLDRHRKLVDSLFSLPALVAYLFVLFLPFGVGFVAPEVLRAAFWHFEPGMAAMDWLLFYLSMLAVNVLHELAHAAACKHYGGRVERIGLMLLYLQPVLFCDVSDSWRFREKHQKIVVAAAGIFLQLLLASAALTIWLFWSQPLLLWFALTNIALAAINLIPFVKLDGYWMLVHWLDEPNLRQKGAEALASGFRRTLGRADARRFKPVIIAFAIGHGVTVPAFWLMGMSSVYRLVAHLSVPAAWGVVALFGLPLLMRLAKRMKRALCESEGGFGVPT
jgi:putative peptide zinc metalloprotease protein